MERHPHDPLPAPAQHVLHAGKHGMSCFLDESDRAIYLDLLIAELSRHRAALHAYVLLCDRVQLLVTAPAVAITAALQSASRAHARRFNARYGLPRLEWARHAAREVSDPHQVLRCQRLIEAAPVRAGVVTAAHRHFWSSHAAHIGGAGDPRLVPHSSYLSLGASRGERAARYIDLFESGQYELAEVDSASDPVRRDSRHSSAPGARSAATGQSVQHLLAQAPGLPLACPRGTG